nr:MAG TPA: hypothetical protein [Caudoviricetes sp.]
MCNANCEDTLYNMSNYDQTITVCEPSSRCSYEEILMGEVSRHCTVYQEADTCELYESLEPVI